MTGGAHERIIFSPFLGAFGGVERLILAICRHLHERDRAVEVLCFQDTLGLAAHAPWPVKVRQLRPPRASTIEAWALAKYFRASVSELPMLAFDLKGAFYSAASPKPFVLHLTDPPSLLPADISRRAIDVLAGPLEWASVPRRMLVHRVNRLGVRKAQSVITMTNAIAREVSALYGVSSKVLRPGAPIDIGAHTRLPRRAAQPVRLLSVSRLEPSKRIDWILNALSRLMTARADGGDMPWQLDIVGDGPDRERLRHLASNLKLESVVTFHGVVDQRSLEKCYTDADIFLMPARQGYGLPALEALARGTAAIVHQDSGVSEVLRDSPWVNIVRAPDGSDLADAISGMASRVTRNELQSQARPTLPTETGWAESMCQACGWL